MMQLDMLIAPAARERRCPPVWSGALQAAQAPRP